MRTPIHRRTTPEDNPASPADDIAAEEGPVLTRAELRARRALAREERQKARAAAALEAGGTGAAVEAGAVDAATALAPAAASAVKAIKKTAAEREALRLERAANKAAIKAANKAARAARLDARQCKQQRQLNRTGPHMRLGYRSVLFFLIFLLPLGLFSYYQLRIATDRYHSDSAIAITEGNNAAIDARSVDDRPAFGCRRQGCIDARHLHQLARHAAISRRQDAAAPALL